MACASSGRYKGDVAMTDVQQLAKAAVADALGVEGDEAEITFVDDVALPGMRFFEVEIGDGDEYAIGAVMEDGEVVFERDVLTRRALAALGPAATAQRLARIIGFLEAADEAARPVLASSDLEDLKPEWREHARLPEVEDSAAGRVYRFWVTSGQVPLWRVVLTVPPAGEATFERTEIWDIEEDD